LDLRDAETEGHSKRVTAFTVEIARAMGLRGDVLRVIARGAFLHDIGKMGVRDQLLNKPGPLDPGEVLEMQKHCELGYHMVKRIPFLADAVAEIVYSHQERWDGTGYPRGLKGEEIPLGARIFAIADTLDAMTSNRPYRAAQSYHAAREEIERWSGRQFDPQIVEVFLGIPEHLWQRLRQELSDERRPPVYKVPPAHQLASSQTN
jgi:putative nucleotidyltransferase with HDIG domain